MKQPVLLGALGIAVLLAGSITLIYLMTLDAPPAAAPSASAAEARPPDVAPAEIAAPRAPPATPPAAKPPAGPRARAMWNAPAQDPSPTPMADRPTRKAVRKALLAGPVQSRLARCVARDSGSGGSATPGRIPRANPAALLLELETRNGEVQIVDAAVQGWGGASMAVVTCARDVLRGQVIPVAAAERGKRLRMPFPLTPRSETAASFR